MQPTKARVRDAFEGAAQAVAMWKLSVALVEVTIPMATGEPPDVSAFAGRTTARLARRARDEEAATTLLAVDAAKILLRQQPCSWTTSDNHDLVHRLMEPYDSCSSVQVAWCEYLWQRAYALVAPPMNWALVAALAELLARYAPLPGVTVERYLAWTADTLAEGATFDVDAELALIGSPFHRDACLAACRARLPMMQTEAPEAIACAAAETGVIPIADLLPSLSAHAHRCLKAAGIRFQVDLEDWNAGSLRSIRGVGKKTLREIVDAVSGAGLRMAPDDSSYPWRTNPRRWR
jgi:hypothetical protein